MRPWIFWIPSLPTSSVDGNRVSLFPIFFSCVAIVIYLSAMPTSTSAGDKIKAKIVVSDAMTVPDRAIQLEAKLTRQHLLSETGVGGEQLEFFVADKKIGMSMTGGDGRGLLEYTPKMRGNFRLSVRVVESPRVESVEGTGTLFSWERRRPIVLVEIEALMEEAKTPLVPLSSLAGDRTLPVPPTPMADAADELKRLTDFYFNVLYIGRNQREQEDSDTMRTWLRENRFPPGPILMSHDHGDGLSEQLADFRAKGWDNLKAGIGRTQKFAEVLVAQRMDVVIVPASDRGTLPKKAQMAASWKEVRKKKL